FSLITDASTSIKHSLIKHLFLIIISLFTKAIKYLNDRFGIEAEEVSFKELFFGLGIFSALTKTKDPRNLGDVCTLGRGELRPMWELLKSVFGLSNHSLSLIITVFMENLPSSSPQSNFSQKCIAMGNKLKEKFQNLLGENGVFIYPTLPEAAIKHNTIFLKGFDVNYTTVFNVLEMPSTHCTLELSENGLPLGFQIMTLPFNDRLSIAMAVELEKEFGGWTPPCDVKLG
ncbi:Fatty-acid amide hydrolase 2-like protein, partial [Leptotrombidium deliense]